MTTTPPTSGPDLAASLPVFPDATGAPLSVITASALRSRRIATWRQEHPLVRWGLWGVFVLGCILAATRSIGGIALVIGVIVIWMLLYSKQSKEASNELFAAYAEPRGLHATGETPGIGFPELPLLTRGDEQEINRSVSGSISGTTGVIAHYTYTVITVDSEGNSQRNDYPHTVILLKLHPTVADRFRGVFLSSRSILSGRLFDAFTAYRHIELESAEFERRYTLRVDDQQDDIALYELMNPPFIQHLVEAPRIDNNVVEFEQRGEHLLVHVETHLSDSTTLDDLVMASAQIYRRYSQEYQ